MTSQPSPLADRHEAAGARTAPFAGWEMPVSFAGTIAEHTSVREAVGVFDVSHLGTLWITGDGATDAVGRAFTNDPRTLVDGRSQYTLCATEDGGVADDLIVYRLSGDRWLAVPNAVNTATVAQRLRDVADGATSVEDASTRWAVLAVQGPDAFDLVTAALDTDPHQLAFGQHRRVQLGPREGVLCRTGYTGEEGVELVVPVEACGVVWDVLVGAGAQRCGLGARDTLRLEMGYPLHGNELGHDTSPFEVRCGWAVKLEGRDFVGAQALAAARQSAPNRRLRGLVGRGRRPPRGGMEVVVDGASVGQVTSGSFSPTLGVGIGLALLDAQVETGAAASVDVRGSGVPFQVVRPPLVDRDPH